MCIIMGRGGGQVVSVLAFYSDDQSSNPADAYSFYVQIVLEKNKNKQIAHLKKIQHVQSLLFVE